MHSSQADYRRLFELIQADDGGQVYSRILTPWANSHATERDWLRAFAERPGTPMPPAEIEDRWRLYALSRVMELLILRFQPGPAYHSDWSGPAVTVGEYMAFAVALGMSVVEERAFSPFHHEVVEVDQAADEHTPVALLSQFWPCLMLGDMLFSRAGVRVLGGRQTIRKEVAESSTLYWAYRRKYRPYQDLSHGWGSNSQWRTEFRRDYQVGGDFYYNVDGNQDLGASDLADDEYGLTRKERVELLTNRCFLTTPKPHDDLWPYDDTFHTTA